MQPIFSGFTIDNAFVRNAPIPMENNSHEVRWMHPVQFETRFQAEQNEGLCVISHRHEYMHMWMNQIVST